MTSEIRFMLRIYFCALLFAGNSAFADGEYLFKVLEQPNYAKAWAKLIASQTGADLWLKKYAKTSDGPTFPGDAVKLSNGTYQIYGVCKTHDCNNNKFYVMFSPNGDKAWGLLLKNEDHEVFFGNPDDEKENALRSVAKK